MSTSAAPHGAHTPGRAGHAHGKKTLAQLFDLVAGATLVLAGLIGFLADDSFNTGGGIDGDKVLGLFEVNGFHNLIHIASGLFLLAMSRRADTARTGAIAFGAIYLLVTLIGLIDGKTVLGLIPVNPADNVLHILLSVAALAAGFLSPKHHGHDGAGHADRTRV